MKHRHDTAHATAHLPLAVPGLGAVSRCRCVASHAVKRERGVCATWGRLARVVRWSMGRGVDILGQVELVDRRSGFLTTY